MAPAPLGHRQLLLHRRTRLALCSILRGGRNGVKDGRGGVSRAGSHCPAAADAAAATTAAAETRKIGHPKDFLRVEPAYV
jgi:hypothetical protein